MGLNPYFPVKKAKIELFAYHKTYGFSHFLFFLIHFLKSLGSLGIGIESRGHFPVSGSFPGLGLESRVSAFFRYRTSLVSVMRANFYRMQIFYIEFYLL